MAGIIAPRTYRPGDLIYQEEAFAQVIFKRDACGNCHESSPDLKSCTGCQEVKYCSKECQRADWRDHKLECEHLKNLTKEYERYFVRLLGKVILKIKGKDWNNIQRQVVNTNVTFDDIESYDTQREGNVKNNLFRKQMKEFIRKYIGEQNMPTEEGFNKIIGKVLSCHMVATSGILSQAGFVFLGLSKFGEECIPNTNFVIKKNVLKIWACKEIKKGLEKITVKTTNHWLEQNFENIDTMNNKCKCTDCSLPYGESVLSKIVDESRALSVISETETMLNTASLLKFPFTPSEKRVDEILKKQEEVLGDTHMLHLRLLVLKCFVIGDQPARLKKFLKKFEECTRKVYGKHSGELEPVYKKIIQICFQLGDILEAQSYMAKLADVAI